MAEPTTCVSEQTAVVESDGVQEWHTVIDNDIYGGKKKVRYLRVTVKQVTTPYTSAERYSFNAHHNGSVYDIPQGIPAQALAKATQEIVEHIR